MNFDEEHLSQLLTSCDGYLSDSRGEREYACLAFLGLLPEILNLVWYIGAWFCTDWLRWYNTYLSPVKNMF